MSIMMLYLVTIATHCIHPQSFQCARGKREFKIGIIDYLEKSKVKEKRCI